ncbi:hypothetical protein EIP91_006192 [Steccherinum ochraceum]|uniref:Uncharacterized protein n=1 Tax=Steccherinum ochraceum TaxID=92696 RepID=A0A4R0R641_9APHY|nr:hypothetical protein EIP91_006192 [Steccherinum ochraceum]
MSVKAVSFRIWCLSHFLAILQDPKDARTHTYATSNVDQGSNSARAQARMIFNYLAIVLARDDGVVAVVGNGRLDAEDNKMAVIRSGEVDSAGEKYVFVLSSLSALPCAHFLDRRSHSRGPSRRTVGAHSRSPAPHFQDLKTLKIHTLVTADLLAPHYAVDNLYFPKYVSTCLHGIRSSAQAKSTNAPDLVSQVTRLQEFVVTHHRKKLIFKIKAIRNAYFERKPAGELSDFTPATRLCDWTAPQNVGDSPDFVVPFNAHYAVLLKKFPAFVQQSDPGTPGGTRFVVAAKHVTVFRDVLIDLLDRLELRLNQAPPLTSAATALVTIHQFVRDIPLEFWKSTQFEEILARIRFNDGDLAGVAPPATDGLADSDTYLSKKCRSFLRSFESLYAVITALQYLRHRSAFRSRFPFKVSTVSLLPHRLEKATGSMSEILAVVDYWAKMEKITASEASVLREKVSHNTVLRGACHCEASIMATLYKEGFTYAPHEMRKVLDGFLFAGNRVIGVSEKSCPLCFELANVLRMRNNVDIILPGHHTVYSHWIPPSWLPLADLERLEGSLLRQLREIMMIRSSGAQSITPSSASLWDDDELECDVFPEPFDSDVDVRLIG